MANTANGADLNAKLELIDGIVDSQGIDVAERNGNRQPASVRNNGTKVETTRVWPKFSRTSLQ